jgi:hypothetical protein
MVSLEAPQEIVDEIYTVLCSARSKAKKHLDTEEHNGKVFGMERYWQRIEVAQTRLARIEQAIEIVRDKVSS